MMDSVWVQGRKLALTETLELARLNSAPRAVLTLGTPLAALLILWLGTGELVFSGGITVAVSLVLALVIFLTKWVTAPAKLAREAQERLDRLATEGAQQRGDAQGTVLARLVQLYILERAPDVSHAIRAGIELPEQDWLNEQLLRIGEPWQVRDIRGTAYQALDVLDGEWSYRGCPMRTPLASRWAAFFDNLKLAWEPGSGLAELAGGGHPDFYLPQCNAWVLVDFPTDPAITEKARALTAATGRRVMTVDGSPSFEAENVSFVDTRPRLTGGRWVWAEDRRDDGVYWLAKLDDSAGILLGGPGHHSDHDRNPVIGNSVMDAVRAALRYPVV